MVSLSTFNCRFCDLEMTHSGSDTWLACELLLDPLPVEEDDEYRCDGCGRWRAAPLPCCLEY
jgi:hypothetical protein